MLAGCSWALDFKPLWEATAGDTVAACFVDALCSRAATIPEGCGPSAMRPRRKEDMRLT